MEFMLESRLTCPDTKFPKRKWKLWTNIDTNNYKAGTDYFLTNKKWVNSALKYVAYSSFEKVSADLRIVPEKIRLNLWRNT